MRYANTLGWRLVAWLVVLSAVSAAGACWSSRRVEPLYDALRSYNEAVRWQRLDDASARVPAHRREAFIDRRAELADDLRVSGYDVVRVRYDDTGRRAHVQLEYTWYLDSRGVVHETHVVQRWERPDKVWVLLEERHVRGEPMPGVEQAAPGPDALPAEEDDEAGESRSRIENQRKRTGSAVHTRRDASR